MDNKKGEWGQPPRSAHPVGWLQNPQCCFLTIVGEYRQFLNQTNPYTKERISPSTDNKTYTLSPNNRVTNSPPSPSLIFQQR
ncbi:unnamed protein product [Colias eurytheme]|nr:unnamed protein product [Colias eurytheme]